MKKLTILSVAFFSFVISLQLSTFAATSGTGHATVYGPDVDPGDMQSVITKNNAGGYSAKQINGFLADVKAGKYDGLCAMNTNDLKSSKLMGKFIEVTYNETKKTYKIVDELPNGDNGNDTKSSIDIYLNQVFKELTGKSNTIVPITWEVISTPSSSTGSDNSSPSKSPQLSNKNNSTSSNGRNTSSSNSGNSSSSKTGKHENAIKHLQDLIGNNDANIKRLQDYINSKKDSTSSQAIQAIKNKEKIIEYLNAIKKYKENKIKMYKGELTGELGTKPTKTGGTNSTPSSISSGRANKSPENANNSSVEPANDERTTIMQLTSIFENSTITLQYGYAEDIKDGRGITFGVAGFCTGTGDGVLVIEEYTKLKPDNAFVKYIPALQKIANASNGDQNSDKTGLDGFESAVKAAGNDPLFRRAQDAIINRMYWNPMLKAAGEIGAKLPITRGELYDAFINHGEEGKNGGRDLINQTNEAAGGTPASGVDEKLWLTKFLEVRYKVLAADKTWKEAVDRVKVYQELLKAGNVNLKKPMSLMCYGDSFKF